MNVGDKMGGWPLSEHRGRPPDFAGQQKWLLNFGTLPDHFTFEALGDLHYILFPKIQTVN